MNEQEQNKRNYNMTINLKEKTYLILRQLYNFTNDVPNY